MASMCEVCKCSTYFDDVRNDYHCENECPCCNENIGAKLAERVAQILAITEDDRDEYSEEHPIFHAEQGPNRFSLMSLFFTDDDGVQIQEDLDTQEITVTYFTDDSSVVVHEGALFDWAIDYYRTN